MPDPHDDSLDADRAARAAAFALPPLPKKQSPESDPVKRETTSTIKRVVADAFEVEKSEVSARHELLVIEGEGRAISGWEIQVSSQVSAFFQIIPPRGPNPSKWLRGLEQHLSTKQVEEIGQAMTTWVKEQAAKIDAKSKETLTKAADLIDEAGWIQGGIISATEGFDAYGAILSASTRIGIYDTEERVEIQQSAMAKVSIDLPSSDDLCITLISWNDDPARTKQEVVGTLRIAASRS